MVTANNKAFNEYSGDLAVLDMLVEKSKKGKHA